MKHFYFNNGYYEVSSPILSPFIFLLIFIWSPKVFRTIYNFRNLHLLIPKIHYLSLQFSKCYQLPIFHFTIRTLLLVCSSIFIFILLLSLFNSSLLLSHYPSKCSSLHSLNSSLFPSKPKIPIHVTAQGTPHGHHRHWLCFQASFNHTILRFLSRSEIPPDIANHISSLNSRKHKKPDSPFPLSLSRPANQPIALPPATQMNR